MSKVYSKFCLGNGIAILWCQELPFEVLGLHFTILFFRINWCNHFTANYTKRIWGLKSVMPRKNYTTLSCPIRKMTQSLIPKYSQGINWCNNVTSVTHQKNVWGMNCVILEGPMARLKLFPNMLCNYLCCKCSDSNWHWGHHTGWLRKSSKRASLTMPRWLQDPLEFLVDVSDIFCFSLLGEGEGGVRGASRGGEPFFIENPRRGGGFPGGAEGPGGCLWRIGEFGGGGAKFFFFGAETSTKSLMWAKPQAGLRWWCQSLSSQCLDGAQEPEVSTDLSKVQASRMYSHASTGGGARSVGMSAENHSLQIQIPFNGAQIGSIVKNTAQKSPLFWRFSGGFLIFSGAPVL